MAELDFQEAAEGLHIARIGPEPLDRYLIAEVPPLLPGGRTGWGLKVPGSKEWAGASAEWQTVVTVARTHHRRLR